MSRRVLITGAAGFIGMHLADSLCGNPEFEVVGIDNFDGANGTKLPGKRADFLEKKRNLKVQYCDLRNSIDGISNDFIRDIDIVVHLAGLPGVKKGDEHPHRYYQSNISAFGNILQLVNKVSPKMFLFASSSSVYGGKTTNGGVTENLADGLDLRSFYAATKWANEVMAKQFERLTTIPTVALRFFTVFGPFGRPDMAYWKFSKKLIQGESIEFWGKDGGRRNFTYIGDVIQMLERLIGTEIEGYRPLNIACGEPLSTRKLCDTLAALFGIGSYAHSEVIRPDFDVESTWANTSELQSLIGATRSTEIEVALSEFAEWYLEFVFSNRVESQQNW